MKGALLVGLIAHLGLVACAGHQDPGGAGTACYRDSDCAAGLICVADATGARVCSDDVATLVGTTEGPPAPEDAGAPVDDAAAPMDPYDGGDPDAG